jgi:cytochrome c553
MMVRLLVAAALATMIAAPAMAGDGKALFEEKGCTACHGEDAKTPLQEGYPRLAGQNAPYALQQMKDIKSGARANGLTAETMKPILEDITEEQMKDLADWLASLRDQAAKPTGAADHPGRKLFMTKTCVACHGKEGNKPVLPVYPNIAGQDKTYILQQTKDIKTGARKNGKSDAMQPVMHLVADAEIDSIADYLSTVK